MRVQMEVGPQSGAEISCAESAIQLQRDVRGLTKRLFGAQQNAVIEIAGQALPNSVPWSYTPIVSPVAV